MIAATDTRLTEAKAMPMAEVVERLGIAGLKPVSDELVGPCPQCGGRDRFGVNLTRGVFGCRRCGAGGDQVALVQHALGLEFRAALDWLCGPASGLTEAQAAERRQRAEANRTKQADTARRLRAEAVRAAQAVWDRARPAEGTMVRDYLARRGIAPILMAAMPPCLRFLRDCAYTVPNRGAGGGWRTVHVGPAMIAAVVDASGHLAAVHRTWLDLEQPNGKARLIDPAGEHSDLPSKKVLGSKKGGAIRLRSPRGATTLVMGEGIETTLSGLIAEFPPMRAAFWAGVDLGNMAGRRLRGEGLGFAGLPDLDDEDAFVPPACITRLIYIQDGDSEPRLTRAKLEAGLRRAMVRRPGLRSAIVHAGADCDLNDVLMGKS